jgi:hypothetical protein
VLVKTWRKGSHSTLLVGMQIASAAIMENGMENLQKIKNNNYHFILSSH